MASSSVSGLKPSRSHLPVENTVEQELIRPRPIHTVANPSPFNRATILQKKTGDVFSLLMFTHGRHCRQFYSRLRLQNGLNPLLAHVFKGALPVCLGYRVALMDPQTTDWNLKFDEYHLHRFKKAHDRVWRIGKEIVDRYGGDASRIWADSTLRQVQERLDDLRVGEQISHMIVGALCDTKWINSAGGNVKADRHLNRVVGRVFSGERISSKETIRLTRLMKAESPWLLDKPLFDIGQKHCHPTDPKCGQCYLLAECCYAAATPRGISPRETLRR
jgi:hypothetical protein